MEKAGQDWAADFDARFTNHHIQKLKILVPFLEPAMQRSLSIYIKYLELQYTAAYFGQHPRGISLFPATSPDLDTLCGQILPYCTAEEQNRLISLRGTLQAFRQYQDMMEMMRMMKELFPEGEAAQGTENEGAASRDASFGPEFLAGMMGMDPQNMEQLMHFFQQEEKGDNPHET